MSGACGEEDRWVEGRVEEISKRIEDGLSSVNRRINDLKWFFYITWGVATKSLALQGGNESIGSILCYVMIYV